MGAFEKVKNLFTINYDEFDDDYDEDDEDVTHSMYGGNG